MALLGSIGLSVDTLLAVGQASSSPVLHMWVAHSLWLIANAVGLSYVPHVQVGFFQALVCTPRFNSSSCPPLTELSHHLGGCCQGSSRCRDQLR